MGSQITSPPARVERAAKSRHFRAARTSNFPNCMAVAVTQTRRVSESFPRLRVGLLDTDSIYRSLERITLIHVVQFEKQLRVMVDKDLRDSVGHQTRP
jgi:hypothetical protein